MSRELTHTGEICARQTSVLLVIDVQEKLLRAVRAPQALEANLLRLLRAARLLGVPSLATTQYVAGLGPIVPRLRPFLPDAPDKLCFSCYGSPEVRAQLRSFGRRQVVLAGLETHICVTQTALGLLQADYGVFVVEDAVSSRRERDHQVAITRLRAAGVVITTTEAVLFEWLEQAGTPEFREISRLVRLGDDELLQEASGTSS